ncbi:hypothetical protein JL720_12288 [Aureococcus anophagefferens]|nr:hypothetical protein JL720_12288 [Aureococcus anophagefferens]
MSALVGGLSGKERAQLDAAVLEYLKKVAPAAADAFAPAPPDAAAQPGALERKWVSVVRLQRRVLDLEAKAKAGGRATPPPGGSYAPRACAARPLPPRRRDLAGGEAAARGDGRRGRRDPALGLREWRRRRVARRPRRRRARARLRRRRAPQLLGRRHGQGLARAAVAAGGGAGATLRGHGGAVSGGCFAHGDGGADAPRRHGRR